MPKAYLEKDKYPDNNIEPAAFLDGEKWRHSDLSNDKLTPLRSIAISLKRIADVMEGK